MSIESSREGHDPAARRIEEGAAEPEQAQQGLVLVGLVLPPVLRDVLSLVSACVVEDEVTTDLENIQGATTPGERANQLADALWSIAENARDDSRYTFSVCAVALAVLSIGHALPGGDTAVKAGSHLLEALSWLCTDAQRSRLEPGVRRLVSDARDGIALEAGAGSLVRVVRKQLALLERLRPRAIDVGPDGRIKVGGRCLGYRRGRHRNGAELPPRRLSVKNSEGKLLLLLAARRAPAWASGDVVSRVRAALRVNTHGAVTVVDDPLRLSRELHLTDRAKLAAATIKFVK